ncbi:LacI family DNA-binding transcriptional regulator [Kosakonia sp. SMBL-WEM22]|uniref:LacI family DNA-binding transcriptional regulator n=1 Tax=Kosakonia sp. SMBL-WEM22 TaxID=2725560 RepID=UPI001658F094|nr:LacI family DNA-binding transcriptional regulator [Kosakonia sp. SMBL-WEM22]QNQ20295.1 LacI family DNA-binding transcriptional regulator [Kosakonia sp. SMBL-WEM22]
MARPSRAVISRAPTLDDVARAAGLSSMTVSRALNTPDQVRPETVKKVLAAVKATGYIPNALAGGLASRRSKLVAVLVPHINDPLFADTLQAMEESFAQRGYQMLLCSAGYTPQRETELVSTLMSRRPDGIVFSGIHHANDLKKMIFNANLPVVETWDITPTPIDMLVGFSHEKAGQAMAEYLLSKGYRRPGLVWTTERTAAQRKNGVYEGLVRHGITEAPCVESQQPARVADGRAGAAQLLETAELDVIICGSDTLAQGAISELQARGLRVPQDVAVSGFGDLDFAAANVPAITTVALDRYAIGARAATLLANRIEGRSDGEQIIDIGFHLTERESA